MIVRNNNMRITSRMVSKKISLVPFLLLQYLVVLLLIIISINIVIQQQQVLVVVLGQKHDGYRNCEIRYNDIIVLQYDSNVNQYVLYNDTNTNNTNTNTAIDDPYTSNNNTNDTNATTTTNLVGNETKRRTLSSSSSSSSFGYNNDNNSYMIYMLRWVWSRLFDTNHIDSTEEQQQQQQQLAIVVVDTTTITRTTQNLRSRYNNNHHESYNTTATTVWENDDNNNNDYYSNSTFDRTTLQYYQYNHHRLLQSGSSQSSSFQYRSDSDRIQYIDPNIVLQEPLYDGKIIQVRKCECIGNNNFQRSDIVPPSNYTYYCPMEKSYCYIPRISRTTYNDIIDLDTIQQDIYPYYYHPVCLSAPTISSVITRSIVRPMAYASLFMVLVILCISPMGHNTIKLCCHILLYPTTGCCYCCSTTTKQYQTFNIWYINYIQQHHPHIVNRYIERYIKDRVERFNIRYQQLQQLHGELVVTTTTSSSSNAVVVVGNNHNNNNDDSHTNSSSRRNNETGVTSNSNNMNQNNNSRPSNNNNHMMMIDTPLEDPLEEAIVRDIYYYRPSLLLKTRIYKGPRRNIQQQQQQGRRVVDDALQQSSSSVSKISVSAPYDLDTAFSSSHDEMNPTSSNNNNNDKTNDDDDDNNDDGYCIICFNNIEIGSKVGVLPACQHVFHSQCLKEWIQQRNVCPLCLDSDVAIVAYSILPPPIQKESVVSSSSVSPSTSSIAVGTEEATTTAVGSSTTSPTTDTDTIPVGDTSVP